MALYAVGDLQGCLDPLLRLLDQVNFDPAADRLWLTGDVVNRGPQSLAALRFVKGLGAAAVTVLGNHDLTLLAAAEGATQPKARDTYPEVLAADDCDELLTWLRQRPLLHHDVDLGFTMVHAGFAPQWDLATAVACARELEAVLRGPHYGDFLRQMFGREPRLWCPELQGVERLRCIVNYFTRLRYCTLEGALDYDEKGPLGSQRAELLPWFELPWRRSRDLTILFGHWASLNYYRAAGIIALDSGCVWGRALTLIRLDDPTLPVWQERCGGSDLNGCASSADE